MGASTEDAAPAAAAAFRRTVAEHTAHIRDLVAPVLDGLPPEHVDLLHAVGRVTTERVLAPTDLPLFRNSQMDGYAVRSQDAAEPGAVLRVVATIPAGPAEPVALGPGEAAKIMTGALVPDTADAVVPVERTSADGDAVTLDIAAASGLYVRDAGSDVHRGDTLVDAGVRLTSRHIGLLAAAGIAALAVRRRPRVAVLTTGAELADDPADAAGTIRDANLPALAAAIETAGAACSSAERTGDDPEQFRVALRAAVARADVVLTSGGISMGDFEVVREVLGPLGAAVGTVAMQPGGPQATAIVDGTPILCFPGNPVSTQLSCELFLAPLLRDWAGLPAAVRRERTLALDIRSVAGKVQLLRGRFVGDDAVELASGPSSHLVGGLAAADCLIVLPAEVVELAAGAPVTTWEL